LVGGLSAGILGDLPAAQTDLGHFVARRKDEMRGLALNWLGAQANRGKDPPSSCKRLPRVVGHCVIDYAKLSWRPFVRALVLIHELHKILDNVLWKRTVVSESDCLPVLVSGVDPASIRRHNLVEEGFIAV